MTIAMQRVGLRERKHSWRTRVLSRTFAPFILVFAQGLPPEVNSARADFGKKTVANLKRTNAFNLSGKIPGKFFMA